MLLLRYFTSWAAFLGYAVFSGLSKTDDISTMSAVCNGPVGHAGSCHVVSGWDPQATAWGRFEDTVSSRGFALLHIQGNESTSATAAGAKEVAFAAGVVEGALTASHIAQHFNNSFVTEFGGEPELWKKAEKFLLENDAYVRSRIASEANTSAYWWQVSLIWLQLDGLLEGYRITSAERHESTHGIAPVIGRTAVLFLNALVDLSSVVDKPFAKIRHPSDPMKWTSAEVAAISDAETHCSAIVKVAADFSDLWTAHNTWTGFFTMLRVAKLYDLPFPGVVARKVSFPGYFGTLSSNDDLFVLSSGLVVQETTNTVYPPRKQMWKSHSVLTWARTVLANKMASDGHSWTEWFSLENSGTINNQWMIIDYNKFTPKKPLQNGTLWVLEQLPGYIESADLSNYLRLGYWPSYNQPFFPTVRELSGNDAMAARFGLQYSYDLNPRAKIFRRDAPKVQSRSQLRRFMRYNNWQHDPFSVAGYGGPHEPHSAENAIASRADLIPRNTTVKEQLAMRGPHGNTDAKLVGHADVKALQFDFVVGPTNDDQPSFAWEGEWAGKPHHGHPVTFNFSWQSVDFARLDSMMGSKRASVHIADLLV